MRYRFELKAVLFGFVFAAALLSTTVASATPYSTSVLANNPLGYWRLDETSGTTAVNLGSLGAVADGVYTNGVTQGIAGATLDGNTAASFDGSNDYVLLPGIWGGTTAGTIEAWVNVNNPAINTFRAIVSSTATNFAHFQLYTGAGAVTGFYGGTFPAAPPLSTVGEWHHFALVANNAATTLYVDGAVFSTAAGIVGSISSNSAGQVAIGRGFSGGRLFSGGIDEVAIYGTALTQAQIQAHIAAASIAPIEPAPEPSTFLLLGLGALGLSHMRRRTRA